MKELFLARSEREMRQKGKTEIFHALEECDEQLLNLRCRKPCARTWERTLGAKGGSHLTASKINETSVPPVYKTGSAKALNELGIYSCQNLLTKAQMTNTLISVLWNPEHKNQNASLDFWSIKWWDNKFLLFHATATSVIICPDSNRKLI